MKHVKAEIIAVGTELLLGQIANTNAQWLSQQLADKGINVFYHGVVGDNLQRVRETFELAGSRSDLVIVTGGLGPTDDDLTRLAYQTITGMELEENQQAMAKIENFFKKANRTMTPNNRKQALVFKDAVVLHNHVGMAPGMAVNHENTVWIFMPGVPREMKYITTTHVLPYLEKEFQLDTVIQSRMLRFIGIGESQLEHQLKPLIDSQSNPTIAPLASEGEVGLRVTAKAASKAEADKIIDITEREILKTTAEFFYGYDETGLEDSLLYQLKETGQTIAAAESLTGGQFIDRLVATPGASSVCMGGIVAYAASVKERLLHVDPETIAVHGTVSEPCAREMARHVQQQLQADIGISFTGVAGPDESEGKPAGTVYIGIHHKELGSAVHFFEFPGDRAAVRSRAVKKGLELLWRFLKETKSDENS